MDEKMRKLFSENLKYYLSAAGKTQADLVRYIKVSSATVSDWCNGNKMPRTDKLQSICNWLGIEMGDLLTERTEKKQEYYLSPETAKVAQEISQNEELRLLFDSARDADPEDLRTVHDMLLALKRKERSDGDC